MSGFAHAAEQRHSRFTDNGDDVTVSNDGKLRVNSGKRSVALHWRELVSLCSWISWLQTTWRRDGSSAF